MNVFKEHIEANTTSDNDIVKTLNDFAEAVETTGCTLKIKWGEYLGDNTFPIYSLDNIKEPWELQVWHPKGEAPDFYFYICIQEDGKTFWCSDLKKTDTLETILSDIISKHNRIFRTDYVERY